MTPVAQVGRIVEGMQAASVHRVNKSHMVSSGHGVVAREGRDVRNPLHEGKLVDTGVEALIKEFDLNVRWRTRRW